jgi:uncharacterized protein (DUF4415 family)
MPRKLNLELPRAKTKGDPENPEWTKSDFAKAKGPETLPSEVLAAFPKTRGRPKLANAKQPVSLRLSPDILAYYKARGEGWQVALEEVLRAGMQQPAPKGMPLRRPKRDLNLEEPRKASPEKATADKPAFKSRLKGEWKAP